MARSSNSDKLINLFTLSGSCVPPSDYCLHIAVNHSRLSRKTGETKTSLLMVDIERASIAHWIVKLKLNLKHKHPATKLAGFSKPLADVYAAVFDVCVFFSIWGGGKDYDHASQWFACILLEFALCRSSGVGKKAAIADLREQNSSLTALKNGLIPKLSLDRIYNPDTHTYKLFLKLFESSLNPHIEAKRKEIALAVIESMKRYASWIDTHVSEFLNYGEKQDFITSSRGRKRETLPNSFFYFETHSSYGFQASNGK
jgi:hypothetical protein